MIQWEILSFWYALCNGVILELSELASTSQAVRITL